MIKWFERNNWISLIIALVLAITIFYISSLSFEGGIGGGGNWIAAVYHFSIFFFFCAFLIIGLSKGKKIEWIMFGILFSLFYAVTDEFHQIFVPGRYPSFGDVLIDSAGIFLSALVYISILYVRNNNEK